MPNHCIDKLLTRPTVAHIQTYVSRSDVKATSLTPWALQGNGQGMRQVVNGGTMLGSVLQHETLLENVSQMDSICLTCETICLDTCMGVCRGIGGSAYWCITPYKFLTEITGAWGVVPGE